MKVFHIQLRSIYVNNRQDYENTDQQYYIVRIRIQGDATATNSAELNINIENLFDNNPTITYDGPCHALVSFLRCIVHYKCMLIAAMVVCYAFEVSELEIHIYFWSLGFK